MSIGASELRPNDGATHSKKRIGRGNGSGHGTYAGKGLKGQKSRSGKNLPYDAFQGGQFPMSRKFHTLRGFHNKWKITYQPINLAALERFADGSSVGADELKAAGLLKGATPVVVLGEGDLTKRLNVTAHRFSAAAKAKIEAAGGTVTALKSEETQES